MKGTKPFLPMEKYIRKPLTPQVLKGKFHRKSRCYNIENTILNNSIKGKNNHFLAPQIFHSIKVTGIEFMLCDTHFNISVFFYKLYKPFIKEYILCPLFMFVSFTLKKHLFLRSDRSTFSSPSFNPCLFISERFI